MSMNHEIVGKNQNNSKIRWRTHHKAAPRKGHVEVGDAREDAVRDRTRADGAQPKEVRELKAEDKFGECEQIR